MRTPSSGRSLMKRLRTSASTGIHWPAHSIRVFPLAAAPRSLTSQATFSAIVAILKRDLLPQQRGFVRLLPGKFRLRAAKVAVGRRLAVDGAQQVKRLDDAARGQ